MPASHWPPVAVSTEPPAVRLAIAATATAAAAAAETASQPLATRESHRAKANWTAAPARSTAVGTNARSITPRFPSTAADGRKDHDRVARPQRRGEALELAHVMAVHEHDR